MFLLSHFGTSLFLFPVYPSRIWQQIESECCVASLLNIAQQKLYNASLINPKIGIQGVQIQESHPLVSLFFLLGYPIGQYGVITVKQIRKTLRFKGAMSQETGVRGTTLLATVQSYVLSPRNLYLYR